MTPQSMDIGGLDLERGGRLEAVTVAFHTLGRLAPDGSNAILVLHGYTSGPDMVLPGGEAAEGAWDRLIGPGLAIDTDRWFVVAPNHLGSCYGSTGPASAHPADGRPYGPRFPALTLGDMVAAQERLLERLGVSRLHAVIGVSYGGMLAFQWAVDRPDAMAGVVPVLAAARSPLADPEGLKARLAEDPAWNGGDYTPGALADRLAAIRLQTLGAYGADALLARTVPAPEERERLKATACARWAAAFDPNALFVLLDAVARFDVSQDLDRIRAKVLLVLSRTDRIFPPSVADEVMPRLAAAGVDARYHEIDSEVGHFASGADPDDWGPALRTFLETLEPRP